MRPMAAPVVCRHPCGAMTVRSLETDGRSRRDRAGSCAKQRVGAITKLLGSHEPHSRAFAGRAARCCRVGADQRARPQSASPRDFLLVLRGISGTKAWNADARRQSRRETRIDSVISRILSSRLAVHHIRCSLRSGLVSNQGAIRVYRRQVLRVHPRSTLCARYLSDRSSGLGANDAKASLAPVMRSAATSRNPR